MIRRSPKRRGKNYRQLSPNLPARPDDAVPTLASHSGSDVTVNFDRVIVVTDQVPLWTDDTTSKASTAVALVTPTQAKVTFAGAVGASDLVTIPQLDESIRTPQGGFVQAGQYKVLT